MDHGYRVALSVFFAFVAVTVVALVELDTGCRVGPLLVIAAVSLSAAISWPVRGFPILSMVLIVVLLGLYELLSVRIAVGSPMPLSSYLTAFAAADYGATELVPWFASSIWWGLIGGAWWVLQILR